MPKNSTIAFDVLLRGKSTDIDDAASNLELLRPTSEAIEKSFRWFSKQGAKCNKTDFGLACEAKAEIFEALFSVKLEEDSGSDKSFHKVESELQIPAEIESLVLQVTLPRPPKFF